MEDSKEVENIDTLISIWERKLVEMNNLISEGKTVGMSLVELMKPLQMLNNLKWQKQIIENKGLKINGIS